MSILKELKKLAVRFTTAESIDQIECQSLSDAFSFFTSNLNVDANGKLLVKEYKEPVEPGEPSGEPLMVLDESCYMESEGGSGFMLVNDTPIEIEGGYEDSNVQIVYSVNDGEKKTFNALMRIIDNMPVIMEITESGGGPCLLEGTEESGLLFACYPNMNMNTIGEGSSTMVQATGDYAYPNTSKVTIWSIEKVASESSGEPLMVFDNALEYAEHVGGYLIVSDNPIDLGGYEDGAPVQIVYSVGDGAKQTLDTYIAGVTDGYPTLSNTGTEGGMLHLIHGTEENGLMFACYLAMNVNTMGEGSSAIIAGSGDYAPPAEIPTVTIWSIEKVASSEPEEPEEEEDPNAVISWTENPYTDSKYKMKTSDTPIEGYEEGDIVRIHYEGAIDDYTSSGYVDAVVEYNYFNGNVIQGLSGIDQVEAVLFEAPSGHYVKFSMWMQGQPDQETEVRPGSMTAVELFTKMDLEETPATPTSLSVKVTSVEKLDVSYLYASEDVTEKSFCEIPTLNLVTGRTYSVAGYWSRNGITDIQNTGNAFNLQAIAMNISESDVEDETKTLITNSVGDKLMIVTDKIAVEEESDFFFVQPGVIDKVKMEGTNSSDMVITNDETAARLYVQYKIGSSDVISMVITSITEVA